MGIEKVRIVPGYTATTPLDFVYYPYTHSLIGSIGWASLAFVLYRVYQRYRGSPKPALILAAAVLSHWFLDLIVHVRDLDIVNDRLKVGFGLWNHPTIELILELIILFAGLLCYLIGNAGLSRGRKLVIAGFGIALALVQLLDAFGPSPPSVTAIGITGLGFYGLLAAAAFWVVPRPAGPQTEPGA